jgi:hypothetical protein
MTTQLPPPQLPPPQLPPSHLPPPQVASAPPRNRDDLAIDLMHMVSWQRKVEPLQKTMTTNWEVHPVQLVRPAAGRTDIHRACPSCSQEITFRVYSRAYLNRVMLWLVGLGAVAAGVSAVLTILSDGPGTPLYTAGLVPLVIALLAGFGLVLLAWFRTDKKGISALNMENHAWRFAARK